MMLGRSRVCRGVVALMVLAIAWSTESSAGQFSEAQTNAAISARNGKLQMRRFMDACASYAGAKGVVFVFAEHFWQVTNLPFTLAADLIWPEVPDARKRAGDAVREKNARAFDEVFSKADQGGKARICTTLLTDAEKRKSSFDKVAPGDAKILLAVFQSKAELGIVKRNADFTAGCMKRIFNLGGRVFEQAKTACECQTKAITDNASDQELDEWVRELGQNPGNEYGTLLDKPWMKRAGPALSACMSGTR